MNKEKLKTAAQITWCPGCVNFAVLESFKRAVLRLINEGAKQEDFAIVTGIGCHGKIFDYINLSGIYGLHGRVLPISLGIKLGNPNLKVIGFSGDGDAYAEGISHFIHTARYNPDLTYIVHDNQTFSLTTGQSTPTSKQGFKSKVEPFGVLNRAINPLKLAFDSGATFIARCNPSDIKTTANLIEQAIKHQGFSFIEMMQSCIIFNKDVSKFSQFMYNIDANHDKLKAQHLINEWDYNKKQGKIPIGIIYQVREPTLEEKRQQLKNQEVI